MATAKSNSAFDTNAGNNSTSPKASHWVNIKVTIGDKEYALGGLGLNPNSNKVHAMLIDELAKVDNKAELLGSIIKGGSVYVTEVGQATEVQGSFNLG